MKEIFLLACGASPSAWFFSEDASRALIVPIIREPMKPHRKAKAVNSSICYTNNSSSTASSPQYIHVYWFWWYLRRTSTHSRYMSFLNFNPTVMCPGCHCVLDIGQMLLNGLLLCFGNYEPMKQCGCFWGSRRNPSDVSSSSAVCRLLEYHNIVMSNLGSRICMHVHVQDACPHSCRC